MVLSGFRVRISSALVLVCAGLTLVSPARGAAAEEYPVLAGVVTALGGAPIDGATVEVKSLTGQTRAYTTSAIDGSFSVSVPPGEYRVFVSADSYIKRWFGGGETMESGTIISVVSGTTDASVNLERGGTLRGTVTIDGAPVPDGIRMRIGASELGYSGPSVGNTGFVDAAATSGAYEIVAQTEHPLTLQLEIYREIHSSTGTALRYWYGDVYRMRDASTTQVEAGGTTNGLDINFPGFATISGTIRNHYGASINGSVEAYVRLPNGDLVPVANDLTRTDGYELEVPADTLTVRGKWWPGEGEWSSWLGDTTDPTSAQIVDLSDGDVRTGLDVRVQGGAKVVGSVSDRNWKPVAGAKVEVIRGSSEVVSAATVQKNGEFVVEGVGATSINNVLYIRISGDGIVTRTNYFGPDNDGYTDLGPHAVSFEPDRILNSTAPPTIAGAATPGGVMTAIPSTWNIDGVNHRFTWYCDGKRTGVKGSQITLAAEHASCELTVRETALKSGYQSGIAMSVGIQVQEFAALGEAEVLGSPHLGRTLRAIAPEYNLAPDRVTYRWLRDGRALRYTKPQRMVRPADIGHRLAVRVVGHLNGEKVRVTSPPKRRAQF